MLSFLFVTLLLIPLNSLSDRERESKNHKSYKHFCEHQLRYDQDQLSGVSNFILNSFFSCFSNMPEREDDHLTPATRLLEKRREMAEVEQALTAQKEV